MMLPTVVACRPLVVRVPRGIGRTGEQGEVYAVCMYTVHGLVRLAWLQVCSLH